MSQKDAQSISAELRPDAVWAIGITGHRNIGVEGETARSVSAALEQTLQRLLSEFTNAIGADAALFSPAPPKLRVICMVADGSDLLGAHAAYKRGADVAVVLPYPIEEYRKDFRSAASVAALDEIIAKAHRRFELPGTREEGARAYERANHVILANIDFLIAVWDGERASGRAGTGDVVSEAVSRFIPVLVIDPKSPQSPKLLLRSSGDELDFSPAGDMKWDTLDKLSSVVAGQLRPPLSSTRRRGLVDLLEEKPRSIIWRFEYPLLLRLFGAARARRRKRPHITPSGAAFSADDTLSPQHPDPDVAKSLALLDQNTRHIDKLAAYYGQLFRSSAISRFLLIIFVAFLSGLIGILFPRMFGTSLLLQIAVTFLVLFDARIRGKRRWQERWLDYRSLAERLRGLRFLHPLGIGPDATASSFRRSRESWTDWYVRRTARGLGPPSGAMNEASLTTAAEQLVKVEIPQQVAYHRRTFRQLGKFERRLALGANMALGAAIAVGAALGIVAQFFGDVDAAWWKPVANILLGALPAAMTALNGIRAEADLVRLVERSAMTAATLIRLRRAISEGAHTYDRIASAAIRVATIMANELSEWRFVLESRRARTKRRRAFK